jgi:hypothetical protein
MGNTPQDDVLAAAAALIEAFNAKAKEPGFGLDFGVWVDQITGALPPNAPLPASASACADAVAALNAAQAGLAGPAPTPEWEVEEQSRIEVALAALAGDDRLAAVKKRSQKPKPGSSSRQRPVSRGKKRAS